MGMRLGTTLQVTQHVTRELTSLSASMLWACPTHCSWWHTDSAHPARWRWHALVAPQTVEQSAISADQGNTSLPRGGSSLHEGKRRGKGSRRGKGGGDGEGGRGTLEEKLQETLQLVCAGLIQGHPPMTPINHLT